MRNGLYREVKGIDYEEIYLDIIKSYPESSSAVLAAMYLTQEWFESNAPSKIAEAFKLLNEFIINYKGNKQFLAPLHYMLSDQYIIHGKQYRTAVKELELAVKTGLSNPRVCEDARYRIARIYDTRLHNRTKALNSYNEFIKIYPASSRSVLAKRYVSELKNGNKR
jgi:TolA-binding protein